MGYVGNTPTTIQGYFQGVESKSFNGNGSDQDFTLDRAVANTYDIEVVVNNVQQSPYDGSYSVSGTTLSFSEAPSTGSNNIYVTYRDTPQPTIAPTDGSVTTAKIADGAVTQGKIDPNVSLGGPYVGTDSVIRYNANSIAENITVPANSNGFSGGPITIESGYTVTVSTGSTWTII